MKLKVLIAVLVFSIMTLIGLSQIKNTALASAEDFPREALVFVHVSDLPALIRLWNESRFKEKYTESENFNEFKNSHLGLKLASRWEEFNSAAGFPVDLGVLGGLTEKSASVALYDIGKLDFVFIAPISGEVFAATKFVQNQDKFKEETLEDGTVFYRANVESDRGRQKQEIIFTYAKGRFVLTTSENLLFRTLANINGSAAKNNLSAEPLFKNLSEKAEPHSATVWVNQTALNNDYYFKRYWLMSDIAKLKNIRAGIFDFSIEEGRLIERRTFLLHQTANRNAFETAEAEKSLVYLPPDTLFYRLQSAENNQAAGSAVRDTILERKEALPKTESRHHYDYSSDDFNDYRDRDYSYLSEKFDETIDEADDYETDINTDKAETDFSSLLHSANPKTVLTFTEPKVMAPPLFAEFRRAAVFSLASPANFNRDAFESAMENVLSSQLMISAPEVKLQWETKSENGASWREMSAPMLGWSVCYSMQANELILANSNDFLREIIAAQNSEKPETLVSPLAELTVLNLEQKEKAYDRIFSDLVEEKTTNDFFASNISGLLNSASAVKRIEVKKSYLQNFLKEEVIINFR
ncbi:MAG TPA: hypothetical protein VF556_18060 [Pyrinomonadaceae bacterium]|jgi:hypothetical protein